MATLYLLVKFLHIISAIVWIGGVLTVTILIAHIARETNPTLLVAMARQSRFYGAAIITPAIGLQLLTGLAMVFGFRIGIPFWVLWGIVAIIVVVALVPTVLLPALNAVIDGVAMAQQPGRLLQKLMRVYVIILLVLLSAVLMMVFKPTL